MVINKYPIGAGKRRRDVYAVCADVTETGDRLREVVRFDDLGTAALVLRYMNGGDMTTAEQIQALECIRKAATMPGSMTTA